MMFSRQIDGLSLQVECDEALQPQARALLADLADRYMRGEPLQHGSLIPYQWVTLRLESFDKGLRVCEPDFLLDDIHRYVSPIDYTFSVAGEQARLMQQLESPSKVSLFTDSVVMAKGSLAESRIYLERRPAVTERDSGWYIGPVERQQAEGWPLESIQVYQLLKLRAEVMPVLALPVGYIATFDGERLEAILDDRDNRVWPKALQSVP